jgi:hypothetical protein
MMAPSSRRRRLHPLPCARIAVLLAGVYLPGTLALADPAFLPAVRYPAGRSPDSLIVGDFNGGAAATVPSGRLSVLPQVIPPTP